MVRGYPHQGKAGPDYIANLAEVLVRYPRKVAVACAHPIDGVAKECRDYMPNSGNVIDWCERAVRPMREALAREARIEAQLQAREKWISNSRPVKPQPNQITYKEFLELAA